MKQGSRLAREAQTVEAMIAFYCKSRHRCGPLCSTCASLRAYSLERLEKCSYGEKKSTCRKCATHCYKPEYREKIREVMRFSGPRMLIIHPVLAVRHLLDGLGKR